MNIEVQVTDNSPEVREALENAITRALEAIGMKCEDYARDKCPRDAGNLRDHIKSEVDGHDVYIGVTTMRPPYGIYVEFGTGIYAEEGGRRTPWAYKDKDGKWHRTVGSKSQPFLRPAAKKHTKEYASIIKNSLENA